MVLKKISVFALLFFSSCATSRESPDAKSCPTKAAGQCFSVRGTGKSIMGGFTGLTIEAPHPKKIYAVEQVSSHARGEREKCDFHFDCAAEFTLCPTGEPNVRDMQPVCLEKISSVKYLPSGQ